MGTVIDMDCVRWCWRGGFGRPLRAFFVRLTAHDGRSCPIAIMQIRQHGLDLSGDYTNDGEHRRDALAACRTEPRKAKSHMSVHSQISGGRN